MITKRLLLAGIFAFIIALSGCGSRTASLMATSEAGSSHVKSSQASSSASTASQNTSSSQVTESENSSSSSINITHSVESKNYGTGTEVSTDGIWEAYDTNKDDYQLHIRKAEGTEDKVIYKGTVLCPCLAGEWVYFLADLNEIDKIKLDGSEKTKVCSTNGFQNLNGSTAITAKYMDGYILYKLVQMKEAENKDTTPNPAFYYKLDLAQNKIIPVSNK